MADPTFVRDLFHLPEQIRKGDFVLKLAEGVDNPRTTAESYVVTPRLAQAFDAALTLVGSALRDGRSQAAYLHGSFGSGKSHFMAMLSLLLAGHEAAWRIPELHGLRAKHGFVGQRRLLELHFHMIGQTSLEAAVFGGYLAHVRAHHPDAPLPGLFADESLFDNAARLRATLGDDAFFAPMNAGGRGRRRLGQLRPALDRSVVRRGHHLGGPRRARRAVHRAGPDPLSGLGPRRHQLRRPRQRPGDDGAPRGRARLRRRSCSSSTSWCLWLAVARRATWRGFTTKCRRW
jgi:hypothetical protein